MKQFPSNYWLPVLTAASGLLLWGCNADTQAPTPLAHVTLNLTVEPSNGLPDPGFVVSATVINDGDVAVHWPSCDCRELTAVRGPDAQVVQVRPPYACPASCDVRLVAPGDELHESYPFTGVVYRDGLPVDAPPGTYTVDARFVWGTAGDPDHIETRQQTFDWPVR